jgi:hypothetical protein
MDWRDNFDRERVAADAAVYKALRGRRKATIRKALDGMMPFWQKDIAQAPTLACDLPRSKFLRAIRRGDDPMNHLPYLRGSYDHHAVRWFQQFEILTTEAKMEAQAPTARRRRKGAENVG